MDRLGSLDAAARWYSDLQDPDLDLETWEAFLDWERDPGNAAAFQKVEASLAVLDQASLGYIEAVEAGPQRRGRFVKARAGWLSGIAAALALATVSYFVVGTLAHPEPVQYATSLGEQRTIELADGSQMTLNTDTEAEVSFTRNQRHIRLIRGQALFEVEKDEMPFVVDAEGHRTTALGTEFDVYANAGAVAVTLMRGSVVVSPVPAERWGFGLLSGSPAGTGGRELVPGERLIIGEDGVESVSDVDPAKAAMWRTGRIQFDDTSVGDVLAELNRYARTKVRIEDSALAAERISGSIYVGQEEDFVGSLVIMFSLETERDGDKILLSRASEPD
ncbi:FecR family protein [Hyphomonas sp. GM-8P]|uniref:FecR family protein n=1 Tax=Hyphomonas sp. GM-8P TaxID=1280945 RepID=UPI0013150279|nr:FecR domain-containing protein [Hyphomonas sp. GM-8P]